LIDRNKKKSTTFATDDDDDDDFIVWKGKRTIATILFPPQERFIRLVQ
jgi:hypothetical protein